MTAGNDEMPNGSAALSPPVIGICGRSGSGKTLLLEHLVPRLIHRGLRVAVIKYCGRGPDVDTPGKDSDRLFRAGADVLALGEGETFARFHEANMPFPEALRRIAGGRDLCLVEGYRGQDIPRIRVLGGNAPDSDHADCLFAVTDPVAQASGVEQAVWDFLGRA